HAAGAGAAARRRPGAIAAIDPGQHVVLYARDAAGPVPHPRAQRHSSPGRQRRRPDGRGHALGGGSAAGSTTGSAGAGGRRTCWTQPTNTSMNATASRISAIVWANKKTA